MNTCSTCERQYSASSRHKDCPSCRYQKTKTITCVICQVRLHSSKYGNCIQCTNKTKSNYGTGRYKKNGYVMVFQKKHPRAQGSRGNYVFEHIIVMEKYLGRYLLPEENVHHKNGIKDDNSIENLELWMRPQPTGVRAKDALQWAQKILKQYESIQEKL